MAKKKKAKHLTRPIISAYLERVNASIFDEFRQEITEMIKATYDWSFWNAARQVASMIC